MPSTTLQRAIWDGHPVQLGNAFELRRRRGTRELHAICRLESHLPWVATISRGGRTVVPNRSEERPKDRFERYRAACVAAVSLYPGSCDIAVRI